MTKESTDSDTYSVQPATKVGAAPVTLEEFLIGRLGNTAGKKLYKELVAVVKEATKSHDGSPVVMLGTKRGEFAALTDAK